MFAMTLNTIETRNSEKKGPYAYGKATLHKKDGSTREGVTVMAFGAQHESVKGFLKAGRKIEVTAIWDGGVLKILGPRDGAVKSQPAATDMSAEPADVAEHEGVGGISDDDARGIITGALKVARINEQDLAPIVDAMINGDFPRDQADLDTAFADATWADFGHMLSPVINAGYDPSLALEIAAALVVTPAHDYLVALPHNNG